MGDVQFDDESGEGDTMVVERERDLALSAQARQTVADIDAALERIADGTYGYSTAVGPADPARAPRGDPVGHRARRGEGRRDRRPSMTTSRSGSASTTGASLPTPLAIAAVVVLVDQLTKHWALERLGDGTHRHVVWTLRFNLTFNSGHGVLVAVTGSGRSFPCSPSAWSSSLLDLDSGGRTSPVVYAVAVGLVIGGAVGNVLDRAVPRRRVACAGGSSTSSTCSGGRSSTSPTSASSSAPCCWSSSDAAGVVMIGTPGDAMVARHPGRPRRRAARPRRGAARRRQPLGRRRRLVAGGRAASTALTVTSRQGPPASPGPS